MSTLKEPLLAGASDADPDTPSTPSASTASQSTMQLWILSVVIALSSFLYGYCISNMDGPLKDGETGSIANDMDLDTDKREWATSVTIIGGWVGSTLAGAPIERFGLRKVLLWNNILFVVGGAISVVTNEYALYVGRGIAGLGVGVEGVAAPMLLAEIAPPAMRGRITTLHQLLLTIGILWSAIMGYIFVEYVDHGWKFVQGFTAVPALVQCLWWNKLPESPRWLCRQAQQQNDERYVSEARQVLQNLRADHSTIDAEITEIMHELEGEKDMAGVAWSEVFALKQVLVVGLALMFFNPLTGINAVIMYSTTIFGFAGFHEDILATMSVRLVNVIMTVVSFVLVDRLGRKILLSRGTAVMWVALAVQGIVLLALNSNQQVQGIISVIGTLIFICGYAVGFGAVTWVILNEILPARQRAKAFSLFVAEAWFWNVIISRLTLTMIEGLGGGSSDAQKKEGVAILFLLFGGIAFGAWCFILAYVPETKDMGAANSASINSSDDDMVNTRLVLPQGVSMFEDGPERSATTMTGT